MDGCSPSAAANPTTILDELDAAILGIEDQVENDDGRDPDWRRRVGIALKKKRRIRPALQKRIADLGRAGRQAAAVAVQAVVAERGEAGCTPQEIATITGRTIASVNRSLKRYLARTKALAQSAVIKLNAHRRNVQ